VESLLPAAEEPTGAQEANANAASAMTAQKQTLPLRILAIGLPLCETRKEASGDRLLHRRRRDLGQTGKSWQLRQPGEQSAPFLRRQITHARDEVDWTKERQSIQEQRAEPANHGAADEQPAAPAAPPGEK